MAETEAPVGFPAPKIEFIDVPKDASPIEFYADERTGKQYVRILDVVLDVLPLPKMIDPEDPEGKKILTDNDGNELIDPVATRFIPKWDDLKDRTCWDLPTVKVVRDMAIKLNGGIGSRFVGPTGVSKSFCVEVICALTNRNAYRHNFSRDTDVGDIVGRFVPKESQLAASFTELLNLPGIKPESAKIIHNARIQSRPLSVLESKIIARNESLDGLDDDNEWVWKNGSLTGSMAYGSVFNADEMNTAPPSVRERQNSAQERRATLRIVEHEGEVIRPLSKEEQDIIDHGGIVPGVIGLGQNFWYIATENPYGIGGREEASEAEANRLQARVVSKIGTPEYESFMNFLVYGDQPDLVYAGKTWKGEKDLTTEFHKGRNKKQFAKKEGQIVRVRTELADAKIEDFDKMPNAKTVNKWVAKFMNDLDILVEKGKLAKDADTKGYKPVYTRRNLLRFFDSMKASQRTLIDVDELFKTGKLVHNTNWRDVFMEGLRQEFLLGFSDDEMKAVEKIVEASGVLDYLGISQNIPKKPDWVTKAEKKGIHVEEGDNPGQWEISRLDFDQAGYALPDFTEEVNEMGYMVVDSTDEIIFLQRELFDMAVLWPQYRPDEHSTANDWMEQKLPIAKKKLVDAE